MIWPRGCATPGPTIGSRPVAIGRMRSAMLWACIGTAIAGLQGCINIQFAEGSIHASISPHSMPPMIDARTKILFAGKDWSQWATRDGSPSPWTLNEDRSVTITQGDAVSNHEFGDFQLHLEFLCPSMPDMQGQARANSGLYLHGRYEIQILDNHGEAPSNNRCGAVYGLAAPLVNASKPPDAWQTYDVIFRAPRFDDAGAVIEKPRMTVLHNGIVIHNNLEVLDTTGGGLDRNLVPRGPIMLQDHGDPIRFRNIWVRDLDPQ